MCKSDACVGFCILFTAILIVYIWHKIEYWLRPKPDLHTKNAIQKQYEALLEKICLMEKTIKQSESPLFDDQLRSEVVSLIVLCNNFTKTISRFRGFRKEIKTIEKICDKWWILVYQDREEDSDGFP